jgi:hypothetical protein
MRLHGIRLWFQSFIVHRKQQVLLDNKKNSAAASGEQGEGS